MTEQTISLNSGPGLLGDDLQEYGLEHGLARGW